MVFREIGVMMGDMGGWEWVERVDLGMGDLKDESFMREFV